MKRLFYCILFSFFIFNIAYLSPNHTKKNNIKYDKYHSHELQKQKLYNIKLKNKILSKNDDNLVVNTRNCGDGICGDNEDYYNCPEDCSAPDICPDGQVADCDGSGECFTEFWIGDGLCDGEDQAFGANLCCYENDGGDCAESECVACEDQGQITCWNGDCADSESDCPDVTCSDTDCGTIINSTYLNYTCPQTELEYGYDCSICEAEGACPISCEDQGLVTCPTGVCANSESECNTCENPDQAVEGINSSTGHDQYYQFTVPEGGFLTLSTAGANIDTYLYLYATCDDIINNSYIAYNDDWQSSQYGECPDCTYSLESYIYVGVPAGDYIIRSYDIYNSSNTPFEWTLAFEVGVEGCTNPTANNYNPEANIDDGSCEFDEGVFFITCDQGSWQSEVSWDLVNAATAEIVISGGAPYNGAVALESGSYYLHAFDSFGDGWNGNIWTLIDYQSNEVLTYTLDGGNEGTSETFTTCNIEELDECGNCSGDCAADENGFISCGNNNNNIITADCTGVCDGIATEDCLGVCNGNAIVDCNGDCNGDAIVDECGVCDGSGIPEGACNCQGFIEDCNGDCGGISTIDACGNCQGDCTADENGFVSCGLNQNNIITADCTGVCDGSSTFDDCSVCNGPGLNEDGCCGEETIDCNGDCGGIAIIDCNGECDGSAIIDCNGDCDGDAIIDCSGVCGGTDLDCIETISLSDWNDINNTIDVLIKVGLNAVAGFQFNISGFDGLALEVDETIGLAVENGFTVSTSDLGIVVGFSLTGSTIPIASDGILVRFSVPDGFLNTGPEACLSDVIIADSEVQELEFEIGDCINLPCEYDCENICNGNAIVDQCGVCNGSGPEENYDCDGNCIIAEDCNGDCGGTAVEDCAGVCGGSAIIDCNGDCDGSAIIDQCGICDGDNTSCLNVIYFGDIIENLEEDGVTYTGTGTAELWVSIPDISICDDGTSFNQATCEAGADGIVEDDDSTPDIDESDDNGVWDPIAVAGVQVTLTGINVTEINGGLADLGWTVQNGTTGILLAFSLTGDVLTSGQYLISNLSFETTNYEACLSDSVISDTISNQLVSSTGDCVTLNSVHSGCTDETACNYDSEAIVDNGTCAYVEDCAGICGGNAIEDECGVCNGDGLTYACPDGINVCEASDCFSTIDIGFGASGYQYTDSEGVDTYYLDITYSSEYLVDEFEFSLSGALAVDVNGGISEQENFDVTVDPLLYVIVGTSTNDDYIPAGSGVLTRISVQPFENSEQVCFNTQTTFKEYIVNDGTNSETPIFDEVNIGDCISMEELLTNQTPNEYSLLQNYPNPFNPVTNIGFSIVEPGNISLKVYDISGREVSELINGFYTPGNYNVTWNAMDSYGSQLSSGIYIYKLNTGNGILSKRMVLMR